MQKKIFYIRYFKNLHNVVKFTIISKYILGSVTLLLREEIFIVLDADSHVPIFLTA